MQIALWFIAITAFIISWAITRLARNLSNGQSDACCFGGFFFTAFYGCISGAVAGAHTPLTRIYAGNGLYVSIVVYIVTSVIVLKFRR